MSSIEITQGPRWRANKCTLDTVTVLIRRKRIGMLQYDELPLLSLTWPSLDDQLHLHRLHDLPQLALEGRMLEGSTTSAASILPNLPMEPQQLQHRPISPTYSIARVMPVLGVRIFSYPPTRSNDLKLDGTCTRNEDDDFHYSGYPKGYRFFNSVTSPSPSSTSPSLPSSSSS